MGVEALETAIAIPLEVVLAGLPDVRRVRVPGVAAVERLGGYLRQFQVQLDPERMAARLVSLGDVMHAIEESNLNASGGIVAQGSIEWTVRALGRAQSVEALRRTVVVTKGDVPVLLGDIADIREAAAVRPASRTD